MKRYCITISFGLGKTNIPHTATDLPKDYGSILALHKGIIVHIETVSLLPFYHHHHHHHHSVMH